METKIEILLSSSSEHYERVVFMDGVEVYMDKRLQSASFPEDTDPIRNLELFLLGEKAEHRCDGCRNAGNLPCPIDNKADMGMKKGFSTKFIDSEEGKELYSQMAGAFHGYRVSNARLPKPPSPIVRKIRQFLRGAARLLKG